MRGRAIGALLASVLLVGVAAHANAQAITRDADFDRWMYPFNSTNGGRQTAPVFGSIGSGPAVFDQRDGQFLVGFDTEAAGIDSGFAPSQYDIASLKVRVTHFQGAFLFDPTYDSYETYDGTTADTDDGRPIELHGVGFRAPYANGEFSPGVPGAPGFEETEAFAFADPTLPEVRLAFPTNVVDGDVSNNVQNGFESRPFAIGQGLGLSAGDPVVEGAPGTSPGTTFEFDVDLSDPNVLAYVQEGLSNGGLFFAVTSLHETTQAGGDIPNFYTSDNFDPAALPPQIEITAAVPEPSTYLLLISSVLVLAPFVWRRFSRRATK